MIIGGLRVQNLADPETPAVQVRACMQEYAHFHARPGSAATTTLGVRQRSRSFWIRVNVEFTDARAAWCSVYVIQPENG